MRFSRERSCSVEIPGRTRCSSTKRRGPAARSRMMSNVHLSPTRSSARASGAHWSYGWRLGGGTGGKIYLSGLTRTWQIAVRSTIAASTALSLIFWTFGGSKSTQRTAAESRKFPRAGAFGGTTAGVRPPNSKQGTESDGRRDQAGGAKGGAGG